MKEHECPNCGAADPKVISEGEFECKACGTRFVDEAMLQRKRAAEKQAAKIQAELNRQQAKVQIEQARSASGMSKRVLLFVGIFLIIIFGFVFYMAKKSMDQTQKAQEEMMKEFKPVGE